MGDVKKELYPYQKLWFFLRLCMVLLIILVFVGIAFDVDIGFLQPLPLRTFFWLFGIPIMVLMIYFAPMLWRNICPLATTNLWHFTLFNRRKIGKQGIAANHLTGTRGRIHNFLRKRGMLVSALLFWILVPLRLLLLFGSNAATEVFFVVIFGSAAVMGYLFPVKSGWCTSICPMSAVEKTYSINPAVDLRNKRCHYLNEKEQKVLTCSGCSFNCMDVVEPTHAYWLATSNKIFHSTTNAVMRKLFIATFPGLIFAYFALTQFFTLLPQNIFLRVFIVYGIFFLMMGLSASSYYSIKRNLRIKVEMKEWLLALEQPSVAYSVYRRRLDVSFVTFAINLFWFFSSNGIVYRVLPAFFHLPSLASYALWMVFFSTVFILSLLGLHSAWKENMLPEHHKPHWW